METWRILSIYTSIFLVSTGLLPLVPEVLPGDVLQHLVPAGLAGQLQPGGGVREALGGREGRAGGGRTTCRQGDEDEG